MNLRESVRWRPLRVLHILGSLKTGGAETWLVQVAPHFDRARVQIDVAVNYGVETRYSEFLKGLGCRILTCPPLKNIVTYSRGFVQILKENGPYDVVHSHLQLFSGLIMKLAYTAGVPVRIAHTRNSSDGKKTTPFRWCYRKLMFYWVKRYSTALLAISRKAAIGTFGKRYGDERHCQIILTAVDLSPFTVRIDRVKIRSELGISSEAKVVGHCGSFTRQKNHNFLLKIAQIVCRRRPNVIFLLIGDGPLRHYFEKQAKSQFPEGQVRFLGERSDVPSLMLGAMDCFLFPSLYEGLGRVLIEAQAAGLPCIASSVITEEAEAYPGAVRFLSLKTSPEVWADEVLKALDMPPDPERGQRAIRAFAERGYSPEANARVLTQLYESLIAKVGLQ